MLVGLIAGALILVASAHAPLVFAIGVALAFFLVPVVNWLQARGVPRIGAAILVVATGTIITVVGLLLITVILVEQGAAFLADLPSDLAQMAASLESMDLPTWLDETLDSVARTLQATAEAIDPGTLVLGLLSGLLGMAGILFSLMLLPFFLFYLLKDQPKMAANFYRNVPLPWKADVSRIIAIFVQDFALYFKAEVVVGSIMFLIVSIGMFVIGTIVPGAEILAQFALLLGLAALVFELIPQIGPILAYLPALLLSLTVSPAAVVIVSIYYFVAFNIEGSILVPTFQGRMISFSGASVLVLIAIGFALAGIIGAIVALPVAAIVRDIFRLLFRKAQVMAGAPPADVEAADAEEAARADAPASPAAEAEPSGA